MGGSAQAEIFAAVEAYSLETFAPEILARMGEYGAELWVYEPRSSEPVLSAMPQAGDEPFTYTHYRHLHHIADCEVFHPAANSLSDALEALLTKTLPWVADAFATAMIVRQMPRIEFKYDPMREHYFLVPRARWVPITIKPGHSLSNHGLRKIETPKSKHPQGSIGHMNGRISPRAAGADEGK